ncbi:hypothetical protein Goshw_024283, partial [Gossypium schwendimanii]|nr:hypothetical protein [Gossypium schwendimanii]
PTLVSALVERWRPDTHTFYLPCSECTITPEDIQLQIGLPMDRQVVIGSVKAVDWKDMRTPYSDSAIQKCIPSELLVNPNIWHVKVPLVVYAIVEMHKSNRNEFLPTRKAIVAHELTCNPENIPWFRVQDKSYMLGEDVRAMQPHMKRPRQVLRNPKQRGHDRAAEEGFTYGPPSPAYYTPMPLMFSITIMLTTTYRSSMFGASIGSLIVMPSVYEIQYNKGEKDEKSRPQLVPEVEPRRNPIHNRQPPRCGTHSTYAFD